MPRYIDADKLFNWGKFKLTDAVKYGNKNAEQQHFSYSTMMMYEIADEIENAEVADVAPVVHAEWVDEGNYVTTAYGTLHVYRCTNCNADVTIDDHDSFCPNCGATMKGGSNG